MAKTAISSDTISILRKMSSSAKFASFHAEKSGQKTILNEELDIDYQDHSSTNDNGDDE
jgi:hypothetical protein